jgi:hypothetical protein
MRLELDASHFDWLISGSIRASNGGEQDRRESRLFVERIFLLAFMEFIALSVWRLGHPGQEAEEREE